jgi:hypothetical protein
MSATTAEQLAAGTVAAMTPAAPAMVRIRSIDLMRGTVMIIDHARDYFGVHGRSIAD